MTRLFHDDGPAAIGQKVCLATTAYDSPDAGYVFAIQKTREALHQAGIQTAYMLLSGNCHVDDARNSIVQHFLLTDCTDLIFLDADVSWKPKDLIQLCRYDRDIVGAVYPYRRHGASESMPVRMVESTEITHDGLIEVEGLPTGFMRIQRHVIEQLTAGADKFWNKGDRSSEIPILFERTFENGTRWGGDLTFCNKWRAHGGRIYAAPEMRLGHTGKMTMHDSFGAWIRRQNDQTLRHVARSIRSGETDLDLLSEARDYLSNPYTPMVDVLSLCVLMARQADGPIIEAGSGLTTVLMAAATDQPIYCLEHNPIWAEELKRLVHLAGVNNIHLCLTNIKDGWYDLSPFPDLPEGFALGVNDGPPRKLGNRYDFFSRLGERCDAIVVDDVDDRAYADNVEAWCLLTDRRIDFVEERAALIRKTGDAAYVAIATPTHNREGDCDGEQ